jgi:hypothetical protein
LPPVCVTPFRTVRQHLRHNSLALGNAHRALNGTLRSDPANLACTGPPCITRASRDKQRSTLREADRAAAQPVERNDAFRRSRPMAGHGAAGRL